MKNCFESKVHYYNIVNLQVFTHIKQDITLQIEQTLMELSPLWLKK